MTAIRRITTTVPTPAAGNPPPAAAAGMAATGMAAPAPKEVRDHTALQVPRGPVPATALRLTPLPEDVRRKLQPHPTGVASLPAKLAQSLNPLDPHSLVGEYTMALSQLPSMPAEAAQRVSEITQDVFDPDLTTSQRGKALRHHTQATAKLMFSITSLPAGIALVASAMPAGSWLYSAAQHVGVTSTGRFFNDLLRVARPVGDTALLIGDGWHLHQVLDDPDATTKQIARASLDVGIDSVRMATYLLTQTPAVKRVAGLALLTRVGLGVYDMARKP